LKPSSSLQEHQRGPLSGGPLGGTWRRGRSLPPCRRPRAHSGPDYRSAIGSRTEGCRRGDHCPTYVGDGAAWARNPEDKASIFTCLRIHIQSARKSFHVPSFSLTIVSVFSSKRWADALIFTATKAVKCNMGTSAGALSHPLLSRSHLSSALRWLYPFLGRRLSPTRLWPRWLPRVPRHWLGHLCLLRG
jgi:hypothetical protein